MKHDLQLNILSNTDKKVKYLTELLVHWVAATQTNAILWIAMKDKTKIKKLLCKSVRWKHRNHQLQYLRQSSIIKILELTYFYEKKLARLAWNMRKISIDETSSPQSLKTSQHGVNVSNNNAFVAHVYSLSYIHTQQSVNHFHWRLLWGNQRMLTHHYGGGGLVCFGPVYKSIDTHWLLAIPLLQPYSCRQSFHRSL